MCRFMVNYSQNVSIHGTHKTQVYKGKDEILLSELILNPSHSILTQSFDSRLRLVKHTL